MIPWQQLQDLIHQSSANVTPQSVSRPIIYVDLQQQLLSQVSDQDEQHYQISTSRYGPGQKQDSFQTPTGIHQIAEKFGDDEPLGRVFKSRVATQQICVPEDYQGDEDLITTRILWLAGLEPGLNAGGDVDSYQRYIYIHGTADEKSIGKPSSIGCIRMKNHDVIKLYDQVEVGDLVIIKAA